MKTTCFLLFLAAACSYPAAAEHDHYERRHHEYPEPEQIRQWVEQGDILSLENILQKTPSPVAPAPKK